MAASQLTGRDVSDLLQTINEVSFKVTDSLPKDLEINVRDGMSLTRKAHQLTSQGSSVPPLHSSTEGLSGPAKTRHSEKAVSVFKMLQMFSFLSK